MSKNHIEMRHERKNRNGVSRRLDDRPLVEFAELLRERGFLNTLVKGAPVFSKMSLGFRVNLPIEPGRPAPEISPGLGSTGFTLELGFKRGEFRAFAERER